MDATEMLLGCGNVGETSYFESDKVYVEIRKTIQARSIDWSGEEVLRAIFYDKSGGYIDDAAKGDLTNIQYLGLFPDALLADNFERVSVIPNYSPPNNLEHPFPGRH